MIYLSHFSFPHVEREYDFLLSQKRTCYDTYYPFQILSRHQLSMLDFEPVTILYGGNGSGKTTVLNVIAEKLKLHRDTRYNRTNFFEDYTDMCSCELEQPLTDDSRIITSDDVFDFILNLRNINDGIDRKREELFEDYLETKYSSFRMNSLEDYEQLKKVNMTRSKTQSRYVRKQLMGNVREHSNGESAFLYFSEKIKENGLYLLDEPIGGVDPAARDYILGTILSNYREDGTLVISTHLISDVERILDEVVFLNHGKLVLAAGVDELREREGKSVDQIFREVFRC